MRWRQLEALPSSRDPAILSPQVHLSSVAPFVLNVAQCKGELEPCLLCACENTNPAKLSCSCRASICYKCCVRELDLRRRCPLCRHPADAVEELDGDAAVAVRCKWGCKFDGGQWVIDEGGCPAYLNLCELKQHQRHCIFRKAPPELIEGAGSAQEADSAPLPDLIEGAEQPTPSDDPPHGGSE